VSVHEVHDPISGDVIVEAGELIDEETSDLIAETSIETVEIRSVLACEVISPARTTVPPLQSASHATRQCLSSAR
jgi:hypothetical protein